MLILKITIFLKRQHIYIYIYIYTHEETFKITRYSLSIFLKIFLRTYSEFQINSES
jgi:hypothetical protein